jgi:hypothetical protein
MAIWQLSLDGEREKLSPYHLEIGFWDVDWDEPTNSSMTAVLANLLSLKRFSLAKAFIQDLDMETVLQETLYGWIYPAIVTKRYPGEPKFNCNLVEFLADIHGLDKDILEFFQREASGLVCYTNLLPRFMPGHRCETVCEASCTLRQLLQLGANPDPEGFPVTPLQIAVFSRDLAGVRTLLEAGADLNNTGDEQSHQVVRRAINTWAIYQPSGASSTPHSTSTQSLCVACGYADRGTDPSIGSCHR